MDGSTGQTGFAFAFIYKLVSFLAIHDWVQRHNCLPNMRSCVLFHLLPLIAGGFEMENAFPYDRLGVIMHNSGTELRSSRLQFDWIQFTFFSIVCSPWLSAQIQSQVPCYRRLFSKTGLKTWFSRRGRLQVPGLKLQKDKKKFWKTAEKMINSLCCRAKHWFLRWLENLFNELHFGSVLQRDVCHITLKDSRSSLLSHLCLWELMGRNMIWTHQFNM